MITDRKPVLNGLRVLDLSRVLAGPWCTQILADLGADVIKVERPGMGDETRNWPPFFENGEENILRESTYFASCNRNKRSLEADISSPFGKDVVKALARTSDILVENFKVGGLEAYGLDYASLKKENPGLIYCSITGFGQTGPYAHRAGYDLLIQGMSGMMSITGRPDGEPGSGALKVGVAILDILTGVYSAVGILAALRMRDETGNGQHIDMSLFDVGIAALANHASAYLNAGNVPKRAGNAHPSLCPYQDFLTKDGVMLLAIGNDGQFARFCEIIERREWASDERFSTNPARVRNRVLLISRIEEVTRSRRTEEWVALFDDKAIPCGVVNDIADAFADPHVIARGMDVLYGNDGSGRSFHAVASPIRLEMSPQVLKCAPPELGQHTREILKELGLDKEAS